MSTIAHDNLQGQRALVTGATSGIGRAVALQLARDGAEVLVHGRDAARGAETVKEITNAGGKASFVGADLTDVADVDRLASEVGDVDILVNNAGIALFGPTAEFDVAGFDKMFASNVRAPFFLIAALAPGMAARGHGSIVSLSSMAGGVGLVGGAAYGATKASLEAMTRAWAAEYSVSGVRVNAIAPGPVYTPTPSGPEFITAAQGLAGPAAAKIVTASDEGPPVATDGPFPESKEFLAGDRVIDVESLDRAIEVAAAVSAAPGLGGRPIRQPIEIREVLR